MKMFDTDEISKFLSAEAIGSNFVIDKPMPLAAATKHSLTFVGDVIEFKNEYERALELKCAILAPKGTKVPKESKSTLILVDNPRSAFGKALNQFFIQRPSPGISSTATISKTAMIASTATIGAYTVIGDGVVIGDNVEIRNHVVIAANVVIGDRSLIKSHAVIGEEGFGIEKDEDGNNFHLPHIGSVVIGNDSEVGSFTTVCSGTIVPTEIGNFSKIDDHVHIAHNCKIGNNVLITACASISGSVQIDDDAWLGPNSTILQGLSIGAKSTLGIGSVAVRSIPMNEVRMGNPARRHLEH